MIDRTHGDSCWRDPAHHACAVAEVERVTAATPPAGEREQTLIDALKMIAHYAIWAPQRLIDHHEWWAGYRRQIEMMRDSALDADALARLRERYAGPKPAPLCPKCRGAMVWDNVWTPRHAPRMVIYVCHLCHQSEHVADGDPEVLALLNALAAERERAEVAEVVADELREQQGWLRAERDAERERADEAERKRGVGRRIEREQRQVILRLSASRDIAKAEVGRLAAENRALREEVRLYGRHDDECRTSSVRMDDDADGCACGFEQALTPAQEGETDGD